MAAKRTTTTTTPAAKANDPVVARSARELAAVVGVSHTAVNAWLRHPAWAFGRGPWRASDVIRVKDWRARELAEQPGADDAGGDGGGGGADPSKLSIKTKADVQLKITRNRRLVFDLEVLQGRYHAVGECEVRRVRAAAQLRQDLLQLPDSLPVDPDVRSMIRGRVIEVLTRYAKGLGVDPRVLDAVAVALAGRADVAAGG
ncbi:MAG TPA: hypothetical protein VF796_01855 [Humisphaera sp.]